MESSYTYTYTYTYTIFFLIILFGTQAFTVHSREFSSKIPKTTLLNVAASIRKTKTTSFNQRDNNVFKTSPSSSSTAFSLPLHSRASVHKKSTKNDYRSLTVSRLVRDSLRVNSLSTRLDLAVHGIAKSDLVPFKQQALEGPIVSGTSQGSGEYFSRLGIGNPPSQVYVVLDTGSDVSWVQCAPCADCYKQADPIFVPDSSDSYSPLSCETKQCKSLDVSECRNETCLYEVSYGDGSYTIGDFVSETVTLGSNKVDNVAIGCGHNNEGLFVGAAGLLGLGGGALSFPSQVNASSFSYCLVDRDSDSASTVEFDSSPLTLPPNAVTSPLLRNNALDTFYYLVLIGLSVGGEVLTLPQTAFQLSSAGDGGIIIDSGTAVTRLQTEVYNSLRDSFRKGTRDLPSIDGAEPLFDTCYNLSSKSSVEVPTVSFHFPNGNVLPLPAKNYLIPVDSDGTFCFAFAPTTSSLSIIGNVQQQGTRVTFDLAKSVVGFVPNTC